MTKNIVHWVGMSRDRGSSCLRPIPVTDTDHTDKSGLAKWSLGSAGLRMTRALSVDYQALVKSTWPEVSRRKRPINSLHARDYWVSLRVA